MSMRKEWYIVQTYSGHEDSVKINLERRIETMEMQDYIFQIVSPEETYFEVKDDGTKKEKRRKTFPGYVFIECIITDESWFVIRNTPGVTGFLGSSGGGTKPVPLNPEEINPILESIGMKEAVKFDGQIGDKVKIMAGPFAGQTVAVVSIDNEKGQVVVHVDMFGRPTPIELKFEDVSL